MLIQTNGVQEAVDKTCYMISVVAVGVLDLQSTVLWFGSRTLLSSTMLKHSCLCQQVA